MRMIVSSSSLLVEGAADSLCNNVTAARLKISSFRLWIAMRSGVKDNGCGGGGQYS